MSFSTRPLFPRFEVFDPYSCGDYLYVYEYDRVEACSIDFLNRVKSPGASWQKRAINYIGNDTSTELYLAWSPYAHASTMYDSDASVFMACTMLELMMPLQDICNLSRFKSKRQKPGHVYLVECDGVYKIGVSNNPDRRVGEFNTMYHKPVNVVTVSERLSDMWAIEWLLHGIYDNCRVRGEWFGLSSRQVETVKAFLSGRFDEL